MESRLYRNVIIVFVGLGAVFLVWMLFFTPQEIDEMPVERTFEGVKVGEGPPVIVTPVVK